jgi:hypothetical protein
MIPLKEHDLIQLTEWKRLRAFLAQKLQRFPLGARRRILCRERQNSLDAACNARQPFGLSVHQNVCNWRALACGAVASQFNKE